MSRWGKCDFKQLEQLNKRLEQLSSVDFDTFCRQMANEIAARLWRKVKKRTPVGVPPDLSNFTGPDTVEVTGKHGTKQTFLSAAGYAREYWSGYEGGTLRDAWTILPIEKHGDEYLVTVVNNTEYASYVEYGHRQRPGRYVPVLGKSLKASWVKGRFMLTVSTQELEVQAPALLEKKLYLFLKEVF